jgi:hypothetical protein
MFVYFKSCFKELFSAHLISKYTFRYRHMKDRLMTLGIAMLPTGIMTI